MPSRYALATFLIILSIAGAARAAKTIRVPADHATIQAAVDVAAEGDAVLIDPGTYREKVKPGAKAIMLASRFHVSHDRADVERTILDLADPAKPNQRQPGSLITVAPGDGPGPRIVGL